MKTIQLPVTKTVNFTNSFSEILFSPRTSPQTHRKSPLSKKRTETVRKGVPSQLSWGDTVQAFNGYFSGPAGIPAAQEREYLCHCCGGSSLNSTLYLGFVATTQELSRVGRSRHTRDAPLPQPLNPAPFFSQRTEEQICH